MPQVWAKALLLRPWRTDGEVSASRSNAARTDAGWKFQCRNGVVSVCQFSGTEESLCETMWVTGDQVPLTSVRSLEDVSSFELLWSILQKCFTKKKASPGLSRPCLAIGQDCTVDAPQGLSKFRTQLKREMCRDASTIKKITVAPLLIHIYMSLVECCFPSFLSRKGFTWFIQCLTQNGKADLHKDISLRLGSSWIPISKLKRYGTGVLHHFVLRDRGNFTKTMLVLELQGNFWLVLEFLQLSPMATLSFECSAIQVRGLDLYWITHLGNLISTPCAPCHLCSQYSLRIKCLLTSSYLSCVKKRSEPNPFQTKKKVSEISQNQVAEDSAKTPSKPNSLGSGLGDESAWCQHHGSLIR